MKRVARDMFMDIPMDTQVHKVKKKYNRKKNTEKGLMMSSDKEQVMSNYITIRTVEHQVTNVAV